MVKSGSYEVKQPNIFGRLGTGFAQGLSEQLPKEVERYRLSKGLEELGKRTDLSPFQQFAGLASIPGVTPQIVQSGTELLKQQQIRDAYARRAGSRGNIPQSGEDKFSSLGERFLGQKDLGPSRTPVSTEEVPQTIPSDFQTREEEAIAYPGAANENPLDQKFIPASPWTQEQRERSISDAFENGLATTFQEAIDYANDQERRYIAAPEQYRQQLDYKKSIDDQTDSEFDKQMQTRVQKEGAETFKDLTGNLQLNLKKMARNAVATKQMTPAQAGEYYSKKALDLVKDKNRVSEIANRDFFDKISPSKSKEAVKNLMSISKTFRDLGSSEDLYDILRTKAENGGLELSPGGAALVAYPRSQKVKDLIKKVNFRQSKDPYADTLSFTQELMNAMTPKDSFLAIARQLKQQDPAFNEYAFFDYLRENQDQLGLNSRLKREITRGVSDFIPNWGDISLFPLFSKSPAND